MKTVLTIAGSDCSGGAGIQADIKTITANKLYASSVITALTAQNTTGVSGIFEVSPEFVAQQLDSVFTDIAPDAVKVGMVSSSDIIKVIASQLTRYNAKNIVVDPVMVATSGSRLIGESAIETLISTLIPLARVITPNIPESEVLCGFSIHNEDDMVKAARAIADKTGVSVLVKGGHLVNDAVDCLCEDGHIEWYASRRINNPNTHGTGCTLSSAIACGLARGMTLAESIHCAKQYLTGALEAMLDLGAGSGPMDHTWCIPEPAQNN